MHHFNRAGVSWIDIMQIFGSWIHGTSYSDDITLCRMIVHLNLSIDVLNITKDKLF